MVHPVVFVDPAAHRHRRFLLVQLASPSSPANRLPSSRQRRSNPTPARPERSSTGHLATRPNVPDRHHPNLWPRWRRRRHDPTTPSHQRARSRSRASPRTPRNDPTPLSSHVSNAARTPSTPPPPTPNDPRHTAPATVGRSPHRPRRPSRVPAAPTSPPTPARPDHTPPPRRPTTRRSPRRHHDPASPTPFDHDDQPGGSRMRTTLNNGCHNAREQGRQRPPAIRGHSHLGCRRCPSRSSRTRRRCSRSPGGGRAAPTAWRW